MTTVNSLNADQNGLQSYNNTTGVFTGVTVTAFNTLVGAASNSISSVPPGTTGQVLTSNGAGVNPSYQNLPSSVSSIAGDTGTITGSSLTIYSNHASVNSGASVKFTNSGTISTLNLTDASSNTLIGNDSGNLTLSGADNCALGALTLHAATTAGSCIAIGSSALSACTTGNGNVGIGLNALSTLVTGSTNTGVGFGAGSSYTGSETNNICINHNGVASENNTTRIGNSSTSQAFIYGSLATTPPSSNTATTGFGSSLTVGTAALNNLGYNILLNICVVVSSATTATIVLGVGNSSTPTTNTVIPSFTVSSLTIFNFSAIVPNGYHVLVNTTGTITVSSVTTQACPM